jgi:hypothetical protein
MERRPEFHKVRQHGSIAIFLLAYGIHRVKNRYARQQSQVKARVSRLIPKFCQFFISDFCS